MELTYKIINESISYFLKDKKANHRYYSFDYCYGFFYNNRIKLLGLDSMSNELNLEASHWLSNFLASWGMFRGSGELLKTYNIKVFYDFLPGFFNKISELGGEKIWDIDVNSYNENNIEILNKIYEYIKYNLFVGKKKPSETLITKIMLGVFGNIPALDENFKTSIKKFFPRKMLSGTFSIFLDRLGKKYTEKDSILNKYLTNGKNIIYLKSFSSFENTSIQYKKAKIIDMIFFSYQAIINNKKK